MMNHIPLRDNYSSTVELSLIVNGWTIPLCAVGPWSVEPRDSVELPAQSTGQVRVTIDGRLHTREVVLPRGAVPLQDIEVEYIES